LKDVSIGFIIGYQGIRFQLQIPKIEIIPFLMIHQHGKCKDLRDYEHPAIQDYHGINTFPPSVEWVIEAEFERFAEPREILLPGISWMYA
jgi:hypothetical protein